MKVIESLQDLRRQLYTRLTFCGQNSGVHGLKFVFKQNANKIFRLFWLSILLTSTGCLALLLMPVVLRANDVSFTPDTLHLHWTTKFPAVTVCEAYSAKNAQRKFADLYPTLMEPLNYDYRRYLTDLIFGRGSCSRSICTPCGEKVPCDVPWSKIVYDVHSKCPELISGCSFNSANISCCKEFLAVDSEYGPCYSFNSLQSNNIKRETLFVVNKTSGPGVMSFHLLADAEVSIHSIEELSTNILDTKFKFNVRTQMENRVDILFSVIEVENEPLLQFEDISVRKCRYSHEIPEGALHTYPVYSYGACRLSKATEESYNYCGCIQPVRDVSYKEQYCNFTGLNCLVTYEALKSKHGIGAVLDAEDCLPSCEESELSIVHVSRIRRSNNIMAGTLVNIKMASLPKIRYQKDLMRTSLDFVVTVGGMVGLFFSASILSVAEAVYLIFRTPMK